MLEKGIIHLVPDTYYAVDALKPPNQASRVSGESLQTCMNKPCLDGVQHLFCWPILVLSVQTLASNCPVIDSRNLNLVFGYTEVNHYKGFVSNSTKYTVEPSWSFVWFGYHLNCFITI
ncbi:hypothetical protein TNCV_3825121 [Trichonephila clavipes]|nr:hypothetical protein TNCV_3825121 [Trichonephila clavipes]